MKEKNTIPFIQSSSSNGAGVSLDTKEELFKNYVNLVNRIATRISQLPDNNDENFDSLSNSGVP